MLATRALRNQAFALLAADATLLGRAANANKLRLAQNNFAPGESMAIGDFVEADFDGYAAIDVTLGSQPEGYDPATDDSVIDLSGPIAGFRWATTGVTHLPETIYGFYLTDKTATIVYAAQKFDTPQVLTTTAQVIDAGDVRLRLPANSVS